MDDAMLAFMVVVYIIGTIVVVGINIFLCTKCLKKRSQSKKVKEQMMFKRMQYASQVGLNLQEINNPTRFSTTVHV
jgi:hypothetical protein